MAGRKIRSVFLESGILLHAKESFYFRPFLWIKTIQSECSLQFFFGKKARLSIKSSKKKPRDKSVLCECRIRTVRTIPHYRFAALRESVNSCATGTGGETLLEEKRPRCPRLEAGM